MDPATQAFFISGLGTALVTVISKLAEKGVIDPVIKTSFEGVQKWLTRGYDKKKDEGTLRAALGAALDELVATKSKDDVDRLIVTLKLTGLRPAQCNALAAAVIEATHLEPASLPDELLKLLKMDESQRHLLAGFLTRLRQHLATQENYRDAIAYANAMQQHNMLAGLTHHFVGISHLVSMQEELTASLHLTPVDSQALQAYLQWASIRWGQVTLPLIKKRPGENLNAHLKQVFVPLLLRDVRAEEEARKKMKRHSRAEEKMDPQEPIKPLSLGDLLNSYPRFILVGPPGCGKTTLLLRTALAFIERSDSEDLGWQGEPLLPVFVRLRNFGVFLAQNADKFPDPGAGTLAAYLDNQLRVVEHIDLTARFFDSPLSGGR